MLPLLQNAPKAAAFGVPISVKAYCCDKNTAEFWAGIWSRFGFKPEMLLTSTVYFEAQPKLLAEVVPRLPPRTTQFVFMDKDLK